MTYTNMLEPILLISTVLLSGMFLGFFTCMFTFKDEQMNLQKNLIAFDKKINKFESQRIIENDEEYNRPRRTINNRIQRETVVT